ncbi:MAG: hypothetical protein JST31_09080 [Actinobacteria bacterium]|nr:hypothetical protein [Actinomycetota bacterium]
MKTRAALATALAAALVVGALAGTAQAAPNALLEPPGRQIWFGVSDTGNMADFGSFSASVHKHPAVIESFRSWGAEFPGSIVRWQTARARPMLHITTADPNDGHELISLQEIAEGRGDGYLVRLNRLFASKHMRAYIRPLGEPNRCLNVYAAYDCGGKLKSASDAPRWYKLAFRRIYVIVHGGGSRHAINVRLHEAGLRGLTVPVGGLARAPIVLVWSPLPAGSPTFPRNRPRYFYPGNRWVDWVGTDLYAAYPEWSALTHLYRRYAGKPFAITEWGVESGDDPSFVQRLFAWAEAHPRCRMLVYYQDFGTSSSYRIQNYSQSLSVLTTELRSPLFPSYAPAAPHLPPPPPGGIAPNG